MENWNIVEILKLGLPGLVFLLSILSFKLLSKEQGKVRPSPSILKSIRNFMFINVALAIMTLASPVVSSTFFSSNEVFNIVAKNGNAQLGQGNAAVCHDARYANRYLLIKNKKTNNLIQVFAGTLIPCIDSQEIGLNEKDIRDLGWNIGNNDGFVEVVTAPPGLKFTV